MFYCRPATRNQQPASGNWPYGPRLQSESKSALGERLQPYSAGNCYANLAEPTQWTLRSIESDNRPPIPERAESKSHRGETWNYDCHKVEHFLDSRTTRKRNCHCDYGRDCLLANRAVRVKTLNCAAPPSLFRRPGFPAKEAKKQTYFLALSRFAAAACLDHFRRPPPPPPPSHHPSSSSSRFGSETKTSFRRSGDRQHDCLRFT